MPLLSIKPLFGELGQDPLLVDTVRDWLRRLYGAGLQATLDEASRRATSRGDLKTRRGVRIGNADG